jgi:hypothetical protein
VSLSRLLLPCKSNSSSANKDLSIKYVILQLLLLCFLLAGCKQNVKEDSNAVYIIDVDNQPTTSGVKFSSIFKNFKLVPLETNEECLIGTITKITVFQDTIYVLDNFIAKALYVFDMNGKFIRSIGSRGQGPGEYNRPKDFAIDEKNQQIQLLDISRVITYDMQGKFIKNTSLRNSITSIACLDGITYLDHHFSKNRELLSYLDDSEEVLMHLYHPPFEIGNITRFSRNEFVQTANDIKLVKLYMTDIYSVKDKKMEPFIHFSTEKELTIDELTKLNNDDKPDAFISSKFIGADMYAENDILIKFNYWFNATNEIFLWKNDGNIIKPNYFLIDDMTGIFEFGAEYHCGYKNCLVTSFDASNKKIELLQKGIRDNTVVVSEAERSAMEKVTDDSNPVLIFFECREKFKK